MDENLRLDSGMSPGRAAGADARERPRQRCGPPKATGAGKTAETFDTQLTALAESAARKLRERQETIAVAESSCGGLISASLLSIPGASAYYVGGAVVAIRPATSGSRSPGRRTRPDTSSLARPTDPQT